MVNLQVAVLPHQFISTQYGEVYLNLFTQIPLEAQEDPCAFQRELYLRHECDPSSCLDVDIDDFEVVKELFHELKGYFDKVPFTAFKRYYEQVDEDKSFEFEWEEAEYRFGESEK